MARIDKHFYTDSHPETWHKNVRAYMLGRHRDMKYILNAIEAKGEERISAVDFREMVADLMVSLEANQVSQDCGAGSTSRSRSRVRPSGRFTTS